MSYKDFSQDVWTQLKETLKRATQQNPGPHYAAFDADGTLWDTDLGEMFFDYQIKYCGLANLPEDPWTHYIDWKKRDRPAAYLWLAQISQGHSLKQVRDWARQAVQKNSPLPIYPAQQKLIEYLKDLGVKVFVVTASVKWAVEPGAELLYKIPQEQVLGVETHVENELVTNRQKGDITWNEGKASSLLKATQGVRPLFCAGNTTGDYHLLEIASQIRMAVSTAKPGDKLYNTEQDLANTARKNNWLVHNFSDR